MCTPSKPIIPDGWHRHTRIYTHTNTRTQNAHMHAHTHTYTRTHACTHAHVQYTYTRTSEQTHTQTHTYTYTYTHTHTLHTHTHAHKNTSKKYVCEEGEGKIFFFYRCTQLKHFFFFWRMQMGESQLTQIIHDWFFYVYMCSNCMYKDMPRIFIHIYIYSYIP